MGSSSCPRKSDKRDAREQIARLLESGAVIDQPTPDILELAERLESMGLIKVAHREYVRCVNFQDRDVPRYNRSCSGKVYLDDKLDEGGDDYTCPQCERVIYPFRHSKKRFKDIRATTVPGGVTSYVLKELAQLKVPMKEVERGVYRLDVGATDAFVCIVDACPDKYLTHDWARTQATCYVSANARGLQHRFLKEDWLVRAPLADIVAEVATLPGLLQTAVDRLRTASIPHASVAVFSRGAPPIVADVPKPEASVRHFIVEVGEKGVLVNGVPVLAAQATSRYLLFRVLWERYVEDVQALRSPNDFRPLSIEALADEIQTRTGDSVEDTVSLRRNLNRFQEDIERTIKQELGLPIGRNDIIQTCAKADERDKESGYRLNPFTVSLRPFRKN